MEGRERKGGRAREGGRRKGGRMEEENGRIEEARTEKNINL